MSSGVSAFYIGNQSVFALAVYVYMNPLWGILYELLREQQHSCLRLPSFAFMITYRESKSDKIEIVL